MVYYSADTAILPEQGVADNYGLYPHEFLHSLMPSGFPPHELKLKENTIVIMLRTLDLDYKVCNGTRMRVERLTANAILLNNMQDTNMEPVWVPRIIFDSEPMPFTLKRRQFPVKLAFCMTIDKSQGSTFDKVGVILHKPVFTHGQLYVAASRTKNFQNLRFEILHDSEGTPLPENYDYLANPTPNTTTNVVYKEIFQFTENNDEEEVSDDEEISI